ncbi:MAG: hypothetical protein A2901_04670 [Elusimicrobia bacterium RIFCSPLOWO2_01_FULL_54_10]|nr:MAG: hypothetical protein A2901_04670 [Elusimicrobia bacterium RIFCSPLOWO2_01_FULL_54_10]
MRKFLTLAIAALSSTITTNAFAAFQDPYWSARVAALSGAFTAVSDDSSAVFYNSAAGAHVKERTASFSYARLYAGLDEGNISLNQLAYLHPVMEGFALGVGWGGFNSETYQETTVALSAAQDLKPLFTRYNGEISMGLSVRYLTRKFDLDARTGPDPVFSIGSRTNDAAVDLHFYSVPEPNRLPGLSVGLSVKALNQPNIGFRDREILPTEISGGLALKRGRFLFPIDVSVRRGEVTPHLGLEASVWNNMISLRGGYDRSQFSTGFGYQHSLSPSLSFVVDYAFLWPLEIKETSGSHRATLGVKF